MLLDTDVSLALFCSRYLNFMHCSQINIFGIRLCWCDVLCVQLKSNVCHFTNVTDQVLLNYLNLLFIDVIYRQSHRMKNVKNLIKLDFLLLFVCFAMTFAIRISRFTSNTRISFSEQQQRKKIALLLSVSLRSFFDLCLF